MRHSTLLASLSCIAASGVLVAASIVPSRGEAQRAFVVIVQASNSVSTVKRAELSSMFLGQLTRWPDGTPVKPVDQHSGSAVRGVFSKAIHGRSTTAVSAYWRQQIFAGRALPPPERADEVAVVSYVRDVRGAIGYVSAGAQLQGTRAIAVNDP